MSKLFKGRFNFWYSIISCIVLAIFALSIIYEAVGHVNQHDANKRQNHKEEMKYFNKYNYSKDFYNSLKNGLGTSSYKIPLTVFTYGENEKINIDNINIQEVKKLMNVIGKNSFGSEFLKINIIKKNKLPPQFLWERIIARARLLNTLKKDGLIDAYPVNFELVCNNLKNQFCNNHYEGITLAKLYFQTENWHCLPKGGGCLTGLGSITYDLGNLYYNYPASFSTRELLLWKKMKLAENKKINVKKYLDKNIGTTDFGKMITHQLIKR